MTEVKKVGLKDRLLHYASLTGVIFVMSGLLLLLDQRLMTGWISVSIPFAIGVVLSGYGIYKKSIGWIMTGLIITGLGMALMFIFSEMLPVAQNSRIGYSLLANAIIWLLIFLMDWRLSKRLRWWLLFVAFSCAALSYLFLNSRFSLLDFIFFVSIAVGLVFLLWGSFSGKLGLIIPGALIIATGAGVYFGWSNPEQPGGLQKTGVMLVWFSLGWGMITVFSRVMNKRLIWWPLIPGGIFLMVGSGLYIGGNPENALGFLANTGSIGLILVGAYLIFLKFGMKP